MAIDSSRLQRHVQLEALRNVREVGGYTGRAGQLVRWHRLYRADDLGRATPADRSALAGLGIRTVIDLRSPAEVRARPGPTLPGAPVDRRHLPLLRDGWQARRAAPVGPSGPGEPTSEAGAAGSTRTGGAGAGAGEGELVGRYVEMLVEGAPAVAEVLAVLAAPTSYPVLVHSALGKDRTGVLLAVVLGLLAVHDESIVEDYALSEPLLGPDAPALLPRFVHDPTLVANAAAGAPPAAMAALLARIRDRARSMVGFARSIGVPFETIEALHQNLLS